MTPPSCPKIPPSPCSRLLTTVSRPRRLAEAGIVFTAPRHSPSTSPAAPTLRIDVANAVLPFHRRQMPATQPLSLLLLVNQCRSDLALVFRHGANGGSQR